MSMPFYVAPEQQMKDRADYARKGIARGRSVIVMRYADGILFVAENRSQALHKVSEIYDRIGFAAVGRYNEFENLRIAGIRHADFRGYSYDRRDVTGRALANAYAQVLGTIFSSGGEKPYEVELIVAELGLTTEADQIYRLTYDGSVQDEQDYAVMGGSADAISRMVGEQYAQGLPLGAAIRLAVRSLASDGGGDQPRNLGVESLEAAVLDRTRVQPRKFRRLSGDRLAALLTEDAATEPSGGPGAEPGGEPGGEGPADSGTQAPVDPGTGPTTGPGPLGGPAPGGGAPSSPA